LAKLTRRIGLSLGADVCWPICYEDIVRDLDLHVTMGPDEVSVEVGRVMIEPFDLQRPASYDLVIDHLTHWFYPSREWIKKAILLDDVYVFNNPWFVQSMEKQTSYCAMMRLGMPIPATWMLPPKEYESGLPDLEPTLDRYARLFDLDEVGESLGFPSFMKPYDGGGWVGVTRLEDLDALRAAYEESGKSVMHVQKGVVPYDEFVRCVGVGPQVRVIKYDPDRPLHERYRPDGDFLAAGDVDHLTATTLTINSFFGWDFNSCESLLKDGTWRPIDFANPCPDSQVTSLHYHFPWLIKAKIRWSLFCAITRRPMRINLDWQPYFDIAENDASFEENLVEYTRIANEHFQTERFDEFCEEELTELDEVAWNYFGEERCKQAIKKKVETLFPEHEWEEFTEHFWDLIQKWRDADASTTTS